MIRLGKTRQGSSGERGFSLIEFGLVMIVSGLMITGALGLYTSYTKKAKMEVTYKRLYEANAIVAETWRLENKYLCPADPNLPPSDVNYGRSQCPSDAAMIAGTCPNGVCVATGYDSGGGESRVLIGMLPFRDISESFNANHERLVRELAQAKDPAIKEELRQSLNRAKKILPLSAKDMAFDGWGHQLTYMVSAAWTKQMSETDSVAADQQAMKLRSRGSIIVQGEDGTDIAPSGAHFALISHGANGDAAYDAQGVRGGADCATLSPLESENCDNDATIRRAATSTAANNLRTDDIVAFNIKNSDEVWEKVACGPDSKELCLRNRNSGNVAVGTNATAAKLTVGGMLRAKKFELSAKMADGERAICDKDGGNCFSPSYMGGTKMAACPAVAANDPNKIVARMIGPSSGNPGIGDPKLSCDTYAVKTYNTDCSNPLMVVYGFDDSKPVCADPCAGMNGVQNVQPRACPTGMTGTQTCTSTFHCEAVSPKDARSYSDYSCTNTCTFTPVAGVCGESHGKNMVKAPEENLCDVGTAGTVLGPGTGPWTWTCAGQHGGATANCSANMPVNGECGTADKTRVGSPPAGGTLCNSGSTASAVSGSNPYNWTCAGTYGGATAVCATEAPTTVNGACGAAQGGSYSSPPTALCDAGTASGVTTNPTTYNWTCAGGGEPVGTTATCSATRLLPENGTCGTAHGTTVPTVPTTNLCATGTATAVAGTGPWSWSCLGINGGSTAACSANKTPPVNGTCNNTVALGCSAGTAASDNGQTACGTTRTWICQGANGGANSATCSRANGACAVNGSCNNGTPLGCSAGSAISDNGQTSCGTTRQWVCQGQNGGSNSATCSYSNGACAVNGSCNNGTPLGCSAGTAISDNGQTSCGTTRQWVCQGQNGGSNSGTCSRSNGACAVNGSCNNGTPLGCSAGSAISDNGQTSCGTTRQWVCQGSGGGSNSGTCSFSNGACAVNGVCGSANGTTVSSAPSTNLCSAGSASAVSGSGPWTWNCNGSGGGSNAGCSANKAPTGASCTGGYTHGQQIFPSPANVMCGNGEMTMRERWCCNGTITTWVNENCGNYQGEFPGCPPVGVSCTVPSNWTAIAGGSTIPHGSSRTAYTRGSVPYTMCMACFEWQVTISCNNGTLTTTGPNMATPAYNSSTTLYSSCGYTAPGVSCY